MSKFVKVLLAVITLQAVCLVVLIERMSARVDLYYVEGYMVYSYEDTECVSPKGGYCIAYDTVRYESCKPHLSYNLAIHELADQENQFFETGMEGLKPESIVLTVTNYADQ